MFARISLAKNFYECTIFRRKTTPQSKIPVKSQLMSKQILEEISLLQSSEKNLDNKPAPTNDGPGNELPLNSDEITNMTFTAETVRGYSNEHSEATSRMPAIPDFEVREMRKQVDEMIKTAKQREQLLISLKEVILNFVILIFLPLKFRFHSI